MPATSIKQQQMMAIAEHQPDKLYKKNKKVLGMSHQQLHDFASTKKSEMPDADEKVQKAKRFRGK